MFKNVHFTFSCRVSQGHFQVTSTFFWQISSKIRLNFKYGEGILIDDIKYISSIEYFLNVLLLYIITNKMKEVLLIILLIVGYHKLF